MAWRLPGPRPFFQHLPFDRVEPGQHCLFLGIRARQFDAVAIGVEEVDRVKDRMIGHAQDLDAPGFEMFLEVNQFRPVLDLEGDVLDPGRRVRVAAHFRFRRQLEEGEHVAHPGIEEDMHVGVGLMGRGHVVLGDGEVEMVVAEKKSDTLRCVVTVAGLLESRKGVNAPGTDLPISSITEKDKEDLGLICKLMLDYVALSFVRTAQDVLDLREMMDSFGVQIPVIAKIEKVEAIADLEAIRDVVDGMMVARGDLGIEVPPQEVPMLQKRIIRCCNEVGKPVITATQMLQSMIEHPRPTRAEASDVANAILDGTDAVMLSGETATGKFPVEAVLMMQQIGEITEKEFPYSEWRTRRRRAAKASVTRAISEASCDVAEQIQARAIVCSTMSGYTAMQIARHRSPIQIMAVSPSPVTQRRLALVWGVNCWRVDDVQDTDTLFEKTVAVLRPYGLENGDKVVITAGVPFGASGQTNLIQIHEIS